MKKIIILTGAELRHTFFRKCIAAQTGIEVLASYCECDRQSLMRKVTSESSRDSLQVRHLLSREQAEKDFFGLYNCTTIDHSRPVSIQKGEINDSTYVDAIIRENPDLLVAYGCSIIKSKLLEHFQGRFLNVHLGLSPYYRGSGTNYWPLVNAEPEYVGATFMYIDAGIDTGEIIHQIRPRFFYGDSPGQIGNRLIKEMTDTFAEIIKHFDFLLPMPQYSTPQAGRVYRVRDYTDESVRKLYRNFKGNMIEDYLNEEASRCGRVPIIQNPGLLELITDESSDVSLCERVFY